MNSLKTGRLKNIGPAGQRGVALVTAILMVAIATTLAAKISWDNQISMRRTEAALNLEQARQLAYGAESHNR